MNSLNDRASRITASFRCTVLLDPLRRHNLVEASLAANFFFGTFGDVLRNGAALLHPLPEPAVQHADIVVAHVLEDEPDARRGRPVPAS